MTAGEAILISNESGQEPDPAPLTRALDTGLRVLGLGGREVSVLLCDDEAIRTLNRDWRGLDEPTDVLSFPTGALPEGDGFKPPLGDIAISVPYAARQAEARGIDLSLELAYLGVHGLLHLAGRADDEDESRDGMVAEMNRIMETAGLPPDVTWSSLHEGGRP